MLKGDRLRSLRREKGLTQEELGAMVGLKKSEICLYEKEQRSPSLETILDFIGIFNVSADYLIGSEVKAKVFMKQEHVDNYPITKEEMLFLEELKKDKMIYKILLEDPHRGIELIKTRIG